MGLGRTFHRLLVCIVAFSNVITMWPIHKFDWSEAFGAYVQFLLPFLMYLFGFVDGLNDLITAKVRIRIPLEKIAKEN